MRAIPNEKKENSNETNNTIEGSPQKAMDGYSAGFLILYCSNEKKLINKTGINAAIKLIHFPGNDEGSITGCTKMDNGVAFTFFIVWANKGPAIITVGIAMSKP